MKLSSRKLALVVLLMASVAPLFGSILSGGSNQNALTTDCATALGQSQPECLSPTVYTIPQTATRPMMSRDPIIQSLSSGVTVTGSLNGTGAYDFWYINITSVALSMHSVLTCPSGANFDLYGKYGSYATTFNYYWCGVSNGSEDVIYDYSIYGDWYITVISQNGSGTYQLTVTLAYAPNAQWIYSGSTVTGSLNGTGACDLWCVYVNSGALSMHSVLTCPSGANFDLYGKYVYYPTTSYYSWSGTGSGGEDVTFSYPTSGYWYIMVRANSGSGTYSLTVTVNYGSQGSPNSIAILASIAVIVSVIFVLIIAVATSGRGSTFGSGRGSNYRPSQAPPTEAGVEEGGRQQVAPVQMVQCKSCGASMKPSDNNCWNCGAPTKASLVASSVTSARTRGRVRLGICMVCKRALEKDEEILSCPYCGGLAHKDHVLEWLHVKDYCPTCGRHLDEGDLL